MLDYAPVQTPLVSPSLGFAAWLSQELRGKITTSSLLEQREPLLQGLRELHPA